MPKRRRRGMPARTAVILALLILLILVYMLIANVVMVDSAKVGVRGTVTSWDEWLSRDELRDIRGFDADCIMVLGASVYTDGSPSPMLRDRLDVAIRLYKAGAAPKLLFTGDSGQDEYNEIGPMIKYARDKGVPVEDIFCDYAGFSTYESVYRADFIFGVQKMLVVTQSYHIYRALYGCDRMGIEAAGVASDQKVYVGQSMRDLREVLARAKDLVMWAARPDPTFFGEKIPITGVGNAAEPVEKIR